MISGVIYQKVGGRELCTVCIEIQFAASTRNRSEEKQPAKLLRTEVRKSQRKLFAADIFY